LEHQLRRKNTYNVIPQDSGVVCGLENHKFSDNRSGVLTLNLTIDKNIPPLLVLESAASVTNNEEKQNFGSNYDHKKYN